MFWRWIRIISISVVCLLLILLMSGAGYQFVSTKLDEQRFPPPGRMVDVGGYKMHLHSMGCGGPTVVLDAGSGCIGASWGLVQPEIAKFTQVVSYDRAGTGWSEVSPFPRTSRRIVEELHTLLENAKVSKPYILVGHSAGGINVQLFAIQYPEEVQAIVLVDSSHEEQERKLPQIFILPEFMQKPSFATFISFFGIQRLASRSSLDLLSVPKSLEDVYLAKCYTTKHSSVVAQENDHFKESLQQLENADRSLIRNKPCIIVTAGREMDMSKYGLPQEQQKAHAMHQVWHELQRDLVVKFPQSKQMIAEKSDHMIPWNQPEIIVQAVQEVLNAKYDHNRHRW